MTKDDGKIVWAALIEIGINPVAILNHPMFPQLAKEFVEGRMTKAGFHNACEVLNVFAGGNLKGEPPSGIRLTSQN